MASVFRLPTPTLSHVARVPICTGEERGIRVPSPTWPGSLYPHPQIVPSVLMASEVPVIPAETVDQVASVPTCVGTDTSVVFPRPSSPVILSPHPHNVPSVRMAREKISPFAMLAHVVATPACTGEERRTVVPSPNSPLSLLPKAQIVPSVLSAIVPSEVATVATQLV